jgi:glucose/arabinose dehydrogenase
MRDVFSLSRFPTAGFVAVLTLIFVVACAPVDSVPVDSVPEEAAPGDPPVVVADPGPRNFETAEHSIRVVTVADGFSYPYAMAFLPDGGLLVTEMGGQVRMVRDGALLPEPVGVIPDVQHQGGSKGLMDVALHPDFAQNQQIYFTYNKPGERGTTLALARGTFDGNELTDLTDIFLADAWAMTDARQNARIGFDNDGMLYMTAAGGRSERDRAQDLSDHSGKTLRLRDDGTPAPGNPFEGIEGQRPEIFTYGHNNIHGIAVHPDTGELWVVEHGDKVSALIAGRNYGWPFVRYGPSTGPAPNPAPMGVQLTAPQIVWDPDVHISGVMFYTGDRFPEWTGDLFVGGLRTQQVNHVELTDSGVGIRESLFTEIGQWVRDLKQGPDGLIYFTTYADPDAPGRLMRIEPAE